MINYDSRTKGKRSATHKMKKLPVGKSAEREIFSTRSGQLVQLQGHAALLAGSGVLVQNTGRHCAVNLLDSLLVGGWYGEYSSPLL